MTEQHDHDHEPIAPDEHELVISVTDGKITLHHLDMCAGLAASALRAAAAALDARHAERPCTPPPVDVDDDVLVEVPLDSRDGRLDPDRKVWTDGTGHAWDLSLAWGDMTDREWRWTGRLDAGGRAPMMRALDDSGETEPLDVVRALYGPIAPTGGVRR